MKKYVTLFLAFILAVAAAGCNQSGDAAKMQRVSSEIQNVGLADATEEETILFTDSCGREVVIPKNIDRIAPSGPLAQIVLYTLCPDKMVGWATEFTAPQRKYIDEKYAALPVFGNFYGDTLNLESVMTARPQVIFDIGEPKKTAREDMDGIQDKTGIPAVFVEMKMDSMILAYQTLGELVGEQEQAGRIIAYLENTLASTNELLEKIPENKRKTVYYGQEEGLTAAVAGTVHADVISYAGGTNVAQVEATVRGGLSEISMEQLLLWNPQVILFPADSIYREVAQKAEWQELAAIQSGQYYEIPEEPYNWIGRPPSVNRVLGIKWLSNLLYPDVFRYDMVKETQDFYALFYHSEITEEQVKELLGNSTYLGNR